jgi:murein L,D-transpeptidase YafK
VSGRKSEEPFVVLGRSNSASPPRPHHLSAIASVLFLLLPLLVPGCSSQGQAETAVSPRKRNVPSPASIDFAAGDRAYMRIFKQEKLLEIWRNRQGEYELYRAFPICHFSGRLGPKLREGDRQAPEGFYYFTRSALNPNSRFHLSFNVGYPNEYDRHHGRTGSFIMVHGGTASIGCFAMTDPLIEEIYGICESRFKDGQRYIRIHIFPFRMTDAKMQAHTNHRWHSFWINLKEGHDFFATHGREPNVRVREGRYVFD